MLREDDVPVRSSLSIDRRDEEEDGIDDEEDKALGAAMKTPLRTQILQVVRSSPDFRIRPARLAHELGISVTDASAELCGLLQAVGEGSTFTFEDSGGGVSTMVFTFPPDFERKAMRRELQEDWKQTLKDGVRFMVKFLKVLTAFGLILSTIIVSIAGMMALVAAFVALSRGGDRRATHRISRQLHDVFLMVRQLLWCYAMFAPDGSEGSSSSSAQQDPFFREAAYDTSLIIGICCGNPMSMWFWLRASHLRQRRRRIARGWGRAISSSYNYNDTSTSHNLEGVSLVRRGEWGQEEILPVPRGPDDHRGLLSLAVEFLFGPETSPAPSDADRWRLRGTAVLAKSQASGTSSVTLQELSPYVDYPPSSLDQTSKIVSETLLIVAHFNGVPAKADAGSAAGFPSPDASQASFLFPELLGESHMNLTRYDNVECIQKASRPLVVENYCRWQGLFFRQDDEAVSSSPLTVPTIHLPGFLFEDPMVFTALSSKDFFRCFFVAILNLLGVIWFAQALELGGILEGFLPPQVTNGLQWALIPVLQFYSKLFFLVPTLRLGFILVWNEMCMIRNRRRWRFASEIDEMSKNRAAIGRNNPDETVER